jgi:signal transduction histidine kinase
MELNRRSLMVYAFLATLWVLVAGWQVEEHVRVKEAARTDLRNRSKDIANTLSAIIRGMRFRGGISKDRLESVLNELIQGRTNELIKSSELTSIALLDVNNQPLVSAGRSIDPQREELFSQEGEHWGQHRVTLVNPVNLSAVLYSEGVTNTFIWPSFNELTNRVGEAGREPPRREPPPPDLGPPPPPSSEFSNNPPPPSGERDGRPREYRSRFRRPGWMQGLSESEIKALVEKRSLHGLLLVLSTEGLEAAANQDLWLRTMIVLLATASVLGSGLAWRNLTRFSDVQIRLVRASEMNSHLRELNLAAAGLAHETRNPLNIIRGLAQMISKQGGTPAETQKKSREIIEEADKVAAQLNEFINYTRPREVRRTKLALPSVVNEVVRALNYDLEEKKIKLQVKGEQFSIEADEQLLRQALFNLILNAIQAVDGNGEIEVVAQKRNATEAFLEVRDNGPGVPPERRAEIFKPYFTTQKTGTGLGLAVVQQIVLAHGWDVECLANDPKGAIFRITHLKLAP